MQLVFTIKNEGLESKNIYTQLFKYTETLAKLLQWWQLKSIHLTHSIVEVKP